MHIVSDLSVTRQDEFLRFCRMIHMGTMHERPYVVVDDHRMFYADSPAFRGYLEDHFRWWSGGLPSHAVVWHIQEDVIAQALQGPEAPASFAALLRASVGLH